MPVRFVRSHRRRKTFLDELALGSSESSAARAAGGTVREFRKWRNEDENFAEDWAEAIKEGDDFLEDVATERAIKKSDVLLLALLKARKPEKFDRGGKMDVGVTINVEGAKQKLLNKLARLQAQGQLPGSSGEEGAEVPGDQSEEASERQQVPLLPAPRDGSNAR